MSLGLHPVVRAAVSACCLAASVVWPVLGYAQAAAPLAGGYGPVRGGDAGVVRVDLSAQGRGARALSLPKGKSAIVELPVDARDVLVTNPAVADAVLRSPRRIFVLGVGVGDTDAVFFDAAGRRILSLSISVGQDTSALSDAMTRLLPGSAIRVDSVGDSVVLSGQVMNGADAEKAQRLAERLVGKPEQVVNMISVAGKEQVMLKVRIVEMQRSLIKQLGFNLSGLMGQLGSPQFLLNAAATLVAANLAGDLKEGVAMGAEAIDSGQAAATVEKLRRFGAKFAGKPN